MTPKIIPLLLLLGSPLLCPAQTTPAPKPLDLDVKPIIFPNQQAPTSAAESIYQSNIYLDEWLSHDLVGAKPIQFPRKKAPPDKYNPHYLDDRLKHKLVGVKPILFPNKKVLPYTWNAHYLHDRLRHCLDPKCVQFPGKNLRPSSAESIYTDSLNHAAHFALADYPDKKSTAPPSVQEPSLFLKKERLGTGLHFPPKGRRPHTIARLLLGALFSTLVLIIFGIGYLLGYFFHLPSHEPPALEKGHRPKEISPNELLPKVLPEKKVSHLPTSSALPVPIEEATSLWTKIFQALLHFTMLLRKIVPPAYLLLDSDEESVPYRTIYINKCATGLRKKKPDTPHPEHFLKDTARRTRALDKLEGQAIRYLRYIILHHLSLMELMNRDKKAQAKEAPPKDTQKKKKEERSTRFFGGTNPRVRTHKINIYLIDPDFGRLLMPPPGDNTSTMGAGRSGRGIFHELYGNLLPKKSDGGLMPAYYAAQWETLSRRFILRTDRRLQEELFNALRTTEPWAA